MTAQMMDIFLMKRGGPLWGCLITWGLGDSLKEVALALNCEDR